MDSSNNDSNTGTDKQPPTPDTPTSQSAVNLEDQHAVTAPPSVSLQTPSGRKKPLIWILAIIVVLLLIGGGVYYFMTMNKSAESVSSSPTPSSTPQKLAETPKDLIDLVKKDLKGKVTPIVNQEEQTDSDGQVVYGYPGFKVKGNKFYTGPSGDFSGDGVGTKGSKSVALADYAAIAAIFEKAHLIKAPSPLPDAEDDSVKSAVYSSDKVVCSQSFMTTTSDEEGELSVACADMAGYTEGAKAIQPFYDAYIAANPKDATYEYLSFGTLTIQDGGTAGYKTASVAQGSAKARVGSYVGLYYQEPGKSWTYFTGSQQKLTCTQYNTSVLKKAYLGDPCYGPDGTDSTVKA